MMIDICRHPDVRVVRIGAGTFIAFPMVNVVYRLSVK
jgi:hypothetical protein